VYEPCTGHIGRTGVNIQHAPAGLLLPFSPLYSSGSLYRIRSLSSLTAGACLLWQPMGTVRAFH